MKTIKSTAQKLHDEQREFLKKRHLERQSEVAARGGTGSGLVDERMLAESMRAVRYASEAHAAADLVDNSIEAGASNVHIAFRTEGTRIVEIAVIDDGPGIVRDFLPYATKWGGSSNDGHRNLFGRFGFGLPSASVNRGRAYDVISRTNSNEPFGGVTVDLDHLVDSKTGHVPLPQVRDVSLPAWIVSYLEGHDSRTGTSVFPGGSGAVRTVVVWRNLDRLSWPNAQMSSARFREHFGITYAGWLDVTSIVVDGKPVEPVDVLFTTPGYRWYDIDGYPCAEPQSSIEFEAKDKNGQQHPVMVRFSYLGVDANDAAVAPEGKGNHQKIRQKIRKEYNGFFVTRNGRFIELVRPEISSMNWSVYSRQVGVAIDFPPELDELFGVTPDKQSITMSPALVDMLEHHGVIRSFKALVNAVAAERNQRKEARDAELKNGEAARPSEETIAKVVETSTRNPRKVGEEAQQEAERNLRRRIKELAAESGVDEETVAQAQEKKHKARPYKVEFKRGLEHEPFYAPTMEGTQMILVINTAHPWYTQLYSQLNADQAELRSGLELLLWVLGLAEIDATGPRHAWYLNERRTWSENLATAFLYHPLAFHKVGSASEIFEEDELALEELADDGAPDED